MRENLGNAIREPRAVKQTAQLEQLSKLEQELVLASEVQNGMMPRSIPQLEGYEFGSKISQTKMGLFCRLERIFLARGWHGKF